MKSENYEVKNLCWTLGKFNFVGEILRAAVACGWHDCCVAGWVKLSNG